MPEFSFASLNPSLLARKGGAKPAMRPQHGALAGVGMTGNAAHSLEDLGWNDMGDEEDDREAEVVHLTPAPANPDTAAQAADLDAEAQAELAPSAKKPVVREQQDEIKDRLTKPVAAPKKSAAKKPVQKKSAAAAASVCAQEKRAAFTLRLDSQRHLKLRLASAIKGRSAQSIVTEALDAMLANIEDLDGLAAQVKRT